MICKRIMALVIIFLGISFIYYGLVGSPPEYYPSTHLNKPPDAVSI